MTEVLEAIRVLEGRGARLSIHGDSIRVSYQCPTSELPKIKGAIAVLRAHKPEAIATLRRKQIPAGAVLRAPRFDGAGKPLAAVPHCWCCDERWMLEWVQHWPGNRKSKPETTAWLEPACGCLDAPQALACCGLCLDRCRCPKPSRKPESTILERPQGAEQAK